MELISGHCPLVQPNIFYCDWLITLHICDNAACTTYNVPTLHVQHTTFQRCLYDIRRSNDACMNRICDSPRPRRRSLSIKKWFSLRLETLSRPLPEETFVRFELVLILGRTYFWHRLCLMHCTPVTCTTLQSYALHASHMHYTPVTCTARNCTAFPPNSLHVLHARHMHWCVLLLHDVYVLYMCGPCLQ